MRITKEEEVEAHIETVEYQKVGTKLTMAFARLKNGFELIVYSGCVDPENYSQEIGEKVAYDRLVDKVWELMGYAAHNDVL